mgnify:CR=1 FL=1
MPKYTEAKKRNNRAWDANHLDRLSFTLPKGQKATVKAAADKAGESVNQYTQGALLARMGLKEWPELPNESDFPKGER